MLFEVGVSHREGWVVIAVTGELDVATAPRLRQEAIRVVAEGNHRLVIDLGGVDFLDSTGLGVIIGILKRVRSHSGELTVVGLTPKVRKVFEVTRVLEILPIFDTVDDAMAGAGSG
ncbi:STAS domain-containing protein [Rhabdothermincola sp.]|uniref:STAS domain-containing protein n=1 Tax=Rhabdothermincola sp. TaxID=2820405 RepID=UPI002FDF87D9